MTGLPELSPLRLTEIMKALEAVPAPPWQWRGDTDYSGPSLCTVSGGWVNVMGFRRLGMQGAQPTFPVRQPNGHTLMTKAKDLAVGRADYDPKTVKDIDNPVARFIMNSPLYVTELLRERNRLARELADARDRAVATAREFEQFREVCSEHSVERTVEQVAAEDLEQKVDLARAAVEVARLEFLEPNVARAFASLAAILA